MVEKKYSGFSVEWPKGVPVKRGVKVATIVGSGGGWEREGSLFSFDSFFRKMPNDLDRFSVATRMRESSRNHLDERTKYLDERTIVPKNSSTQLAEQ